jgi:hypothetical protein
MANRPEWVSGNVFIRSHVMGKGDQIDGHTHHFDHTSIVFTGSVHVRSVHPDGRVVEKDFTAPAHFLVKAGVDHAITAIAEDTNFWCVYSHRDPQGRITQEFTGWEEAYV